MGCESSTASIQNEPVPQKIVENENQIAVNARKKQITTTRKQIPESIKGKTLYAVFECTSISKQSLEEYKIYGVFIQRSAATQKLNGMTNQHKQKNSCESIVVNYESASSSIFWQPKFNLWTNKDCTKRISLEDIVNKLNLQKPEKQGLQGKTVYIVFECVGTHQGEDDHQFVNAFLSQEEADKCLLTVEGSHKQKNIVLPLLVEFNPNSKPLGWNASYKAWVNANLTTMVSLSMLQSKLKGK